MFVAAIDLPNAGAITTVTGLLATLFILFMRDSARNDQRADAVNAELVAAARAERDRAMEDARVFREQCDMLSRQLNEQRVRHLAREYQLTLLLQTHGIDIPPPPSGEGDIA